MTSSSRVPASGSQDETSRLIQQLATADTVTFQLCQSEPGSQQCTGPSPSIQGKDFGLVPVVWTINALTLSNIEQTDEGFRARASFNSTVNGFSPWCQSTHIEVRADINRYVLTSVDTMLCNWLVYGNAKFKLSLSIDNLYADQTDTARGFAGFFEWHVTGTLNGASSGFYMAKHTQDLS